MNHHKHDKKDRIMNLVQDQLGKNVNAELIDEVAKHMKKCPECNIYVDSVHQTIKLIRNIDAHNSLPNGVEKRIYKTLKLE